MRVLHIISSLDNGGAEAVLCRLCLASSARAGDAVVSLTTSGLYADRLRDAGLTVHALAMPRRAPSFAGIARLFGIVRAVRPDIVQTWLYHGDLIGGLVAKFAGQRHVVWNLRNSSLDPVTTPRFTRLVVKACAQLSAIVPKRIISCSESAMKLHAALGYPLAQMILVPNGYDCEVFRPDRGERAALRRELGLADTEPLLGMVARFDPQKDVATLLDALEKLAQNHTKFTCLLVGAGMESANANLVAMIETRGLARRIRLLGARTDTPAVMNAIDVHVLSSAYGEAFPNVVAEAMACGTPAVATDVGDTASIVGETGWIVPPRDSRALADALATALADRANPAAWSERQEACRKRIVANYDLARMVAGYEAVWRDVIAQRGRA